MVKCLVSVPKTELSFLTLKMGASFDASVFLSVYKKNTNREINVHGVLLVKI